jgi:esterase/lipase superfamily enzyme
MHGDAAVPWIVFCWPSIGSAITWPKRDAVFTAAYHRDSTMADSSRSAFAAALATIREGVPSRQLVVASHSLGGQLVGETLRDDEAVRLALSREPLRAVAFLMPDIAASRLRDSIAPVLPAIATRRVLYVSRRDRVLRVAKMIRDNERAGLRSDSPWSAPSDSHMETVDVSDAVTDEGWFQQRFGTHHAVKRQVGLLFDLVHIVGAERAASCREQIGTAFLAPSGIMELQRKRPSADAARVCPTFNAGSTR